MQHQRVVDSTQTNEHMAGHSHATTEPSVHSTADYMLHLQRIIGNHAVTSFIQPKLKHAQAGSPRIQLAAEPSAIQGEQSDNSGAAVPLIVEDDTVTLAPGQMRKSDFLNALQAEISVTADDAMSNTGMSTGGSQIDQQISRLREQDSGHVESAMRRYAPEATTANELLRGASERARSAADEWKQTGNVSGSAELMELAAGAGGGLLGGIGTAFSTLAGSISGIFHKGKNGGGNHTHRDPEQIRTHLGKGHSLDGGVQSRMGAAFGHDFSNVRVHSDANAADLSESLNARAFTVGGDIAFGVGEYRPGTLIGDALIAHELAHVVQQKGGTIVGNTMQKGSSSTGDLEEDADLSAVGVMARLWGGTTDLLKEMGQEAVPRMRAGLQLQTCCCRGTPTTAAGSPLTLAVLAEMTPWQLSQMPEDDVECAAGTAAPGRPKVSDYVRARLFARRNLEFDIDTPPGPGRDPTAQELIVLNRDLSELLATPGVQEAMGDRGGVGQLPNEAGRPTLRGRVRLATIQGLGAARYRLDKYLGLLVSSAEALQREQSQQIPTSDSPVVTDQERGVADYYKHAHAPPIPNGLYQVQEDRIYVLETNLMNPSNAFVSRHETAHLISGGERVRQAFVRRFGSQWLEWWEPFNEGMAELISIESLPQGQAPPPAPTYTTPGGVIVEGQRYEEYVEQMRQITADPANRELFLRAFFTGDIPERVFELLAQARNRRLPPPVR